MVFTLRDTDVDAFGVQLDVLTGNSLRAMGVNVVVRRQGDVALGGTQYHAVVAVAQDLLVIPTFIVTVSGHEGAVADFEGRP